MGIVASCRECNTPLKAVVKDGNQLGWHCPGCFLTYEVAENNLVGEATGRAGIVAGGMCPTCGQVMPVVGQPEPSASNVTRRADISPPEEAPGLQMGVPDGPREPLGATDTSANEEELEDPLDVGEEVEEDEPTPRATNRGRGRKADS